jgi:hypothetical protein
MTIDILWTTVLDPRCRSLKHLNVNEKKHAKNILIDEVIDIIKAEKVSEAPTINVTSDDHDKSAEIHDALNVFDSPVKAFSTAEIESPNEDTFKQRSELVEASAKREVENYMDRTMVVDSDVNSLNWWKAHKHRFPRISILARKWLCVPASSTPSERVFSDCGLALTAKRSRLKGSVLRDQVMIRRNASCLTITQDDLTKAFSKQ